jgi:hypothetical protein
MNKIDVRILKVEFFSTCNPLKDFDTIINSSKISLIYRLQIYQDAIQIKAV